MNKDKIINILEPYIIKNIISIIYDYLHVKIYERPIKKQYLTHLGNFFFKDIKEINRYTYNIIMYRDLTENDLLYILESSDFKNEEKKKILFNIVKYYDLSNKLINYISKNYSKYLTINNDGFTIYNNNVGLVCRTSI